VSVRSAVRSALEPLLGEERLLRLGQAERDARRRLAEMLAPSSSPPQPGSPAESSWRSANAPADHRPVGSFPEPTATLHKFLGGLHKSFAPRTYLEIGVRKGASLALSSARSIGVDPAYRITAPIRGVVELVRTTSDDFFARPDAIAFFDGQPVDLALIDGLHLAEFAFRDFANAERLCGPASVIVLDDMLPRTRAEAGRTRCPGPWAGDVYKVASILRERRPDLTVIPVNTRPTGVVVVIGLDPESTVLLDSYPELRSELESPDPQRVPADVFARTGAADPVELLASPLWQRLQELRGDADRTAVAGAIGALIRA
jgi:hypothetical protein